LSLGKPKKQAIDAFVDDRDARPKAEPRTAKRSGGDAPEKGFGIVPRADGSLKARVTLYVQPDLAKRWKMFCVERDVDMSELGAEALEAFMREQRKRAGD
jgi:hypothetical protein